MSERLDEQQLEAIEERTVPAAPSVPQLRDDVFRLLAEVWALRSERDWLWRGIRDHEVGVRMSRNQAQAKAEDERLWSLLDGEADG